MIFRRKLLAVFALTVVMSVAAVSWLVSAMIRRAFQKAENERAASLVTQFQREFERQGDDAVRRVQALPAPQPGTRMAAALNRSPGESSGDFDFPQTTAAKY